MPIEPIILIGGPAHRLEVDHVGDTYTLEKWTAPSYTQRHTYHRSEEHLNGRRVFNWEGFLIRPLTG